MSLRVAFMGTPDFAVPALRAVHEKFEVVAVYSQEDKRVGRGQKVRETPVKAFALELGLPVFQPRRLACGEEMSRLRAMELDFLVVAAYGKILRRELLEMPRLGCINIHSSLLPRWRGAAPIQWAIMAGDHESGVTTMYMAEELDAGDILLQERVELDPRETASSLHDQLSAMGARLIVPTLEGLASGNLIGQAQDESLVTHAGKLTKEMQWLFAESSAAELDRQVRALTPWPGTRVMLNDGRRLKILEAVPGEPAGVGGGRGKLWHDGSRLYFICHDGSALELLRVQWDGKSAVDALGFINGMKGQAGSEDGLPVKARSEVLNGD